MSVSPLCVEASWSRNQKTLALCTCFSQAPRQSSSVWHSVSFVSVSNSELALNSCSPDSPRQSNPITPEQILENLSQGLQCHSQPERESIVWKKGRQSNCTDWQLSGNTGTAERHSAIQSACLKGVHGSTKNFLGALPVCRLGFPCCLEDAYPNWECFFLKFSYSEWEFTLNVL